LLKHIEDITGTHVMSKIKIDKSTVSTEEGNIHIGDKNISAQNVTFIQSAPPFEEEVLAEPSVPEFPVFPSFPPIGYDTWRKTPKKKLKILSYSVLVLLLIIGIIFGLGIMLRHKFGLISVTSILFLVTLILSLAFIRVKKNIVLLSIIIGAAITGLAIRTQILMIYWDGGWNYGSAIERIFTGDGSKEQMLFCIFCGSLSATLSASISRNFTGMILGEPRSEMKS